MIAPDVRFRYRAIDLLERARARVLNREQLSTVDVMAAQKYGWALDRFVENDIPEDALDYVADAWVLLYPDCPPVQYAEEIWFLVRARELVRESPDQLGTDAVLSTALTAFEVGRPNPGARNAVKTAKALLGEAA